MLVVSMPSTSSCTETQDKLATIFSNAVIALDTPDFRSQLEAALSAVQATIETASLNEEITCLADSIVQSITAMLKAKLDLELACSTLQLEFMSLCERRISRSDPSPKAIRQSVKPSLQSPRYPTSTPIASALAPIIPSNDSTMSVSESARSASDPNPLPEFIEHAYKFFVTHIFNPYPTRDEKEAIVDQTKDTRVTFTSVSNWFTNTRRRCGWSDILKRRCNGNREKMINLAKRVFVCPDPRNPVGKHIVAEFLEMKENVESMYERKTRTSSWIENLEDIDELVNPISEEERLAAKKIETKMECELRRKEKEMLKEQREFERQKRKMQAEALRKAETVTKRMQREQTQTENQPRKERIPSFSSLFDVVEEEEEVSEESRLVAGGKRKDFHQDGGFDGIRNVSPTSSLSSFSFSSDSSGDRVPSLSWSDSGDEERPYKRSKFSTNMPQKLSSTLEIPNSFNYDFNFDHLMDPADANISYTELLNCSVNPVDTLVADNLSSRVQKRPHEADESEPTPRSKRAKPAPISASALIQATPISSFSFAPTSPTSVTPTQPGRRRSSYTPLSIETILGLNNSNPEPVQMALPDTSIPVEVDLYKWPNTGMVPFETSGVADADSQGDVSELLQWFQQQGQVPQALDSQSTSLGRQQQQETQQLQVDLSSYSLPSSPWPQSSNASPVEMPESYPLDLDGLMGDLVSADALSDMGLEHRESVPCTPEELLRSPSASPAWTLSDPATPSTPEQTAMVANLAEKALSKEQKRKELAEKKAALERERARIAEMERELEED